MCFFVRLKVAIILIVFVCAFSQAIFAHPQDDNSTKYKESLKNGVGPFTLTELGGHSMLPVDESPLCRSCGSVGVEHSIRQRALRDIGLHCGRCHLWAEDSHFVLRNRLRIEPMIRAGHGTKSLNEKRRTFMLRAFEKFDDKIYQFAEEGNEPVKAKAR